MKNFTYLSYDKARPLIKEGDVLLFRGNKWYSFLIKKVTQSLYSHAALASWHNGDDELLELIEFNLGAGGAAKNFDHIVETHHGRIDVYRPSPRRYDLEYTHDTGILIRESEYDGKAVTQTMRQLTALPYSLFKIGLLARGYMFGLRLLNNVMSMSDDTAKQSPTHVCSTSVSYSMNVNGYDLVKNRADLKTEPGDLANSPLLNYLFTIE